MKTPKLDTIVGIAIIVSAFIALFTFLRDSPEQESPRKSPKPSPVISPGSTILTDEPPPTSEENVFTIENGNPRFIHLLEATVSVDFSSEEGISFPLITISPSKGKLINQLTKKGESIEFENYYVNIVEVDYVMETIKISISE